MNILQNDNQDRGKILGRRAVMLGGGKVALFSLLLGRMFYLQILESDKYTTLATRNSVNVQLLQPERGQILDRNGIPMAINKENFRALLVPEATDDIGETIDSVARILGMSDRDKARILHEAKRHHKFVPVQVRENLTWEEVASIELNAPDLPGVMIDVSQIRYYPLMGLGAHLIGYVSAVTENDLQNSNDRLLELPGFRIGKAGLERVYDMSLRGKSGTRQVEVNAVGRMVREISHIDGEAGDDLSLTIDLDLQKYATERLGEQSGSVVVMDIKKGDILVITSTPSFDPNAFSRGLTPEEWKDLSGDPRAPMTNKAISGQYPPGSTFKMMVALAALENGFITKDHCVDCQGQMFLGDLSWYCDKRHGVLNLKSAIQQSCDVYFYDVAHRVGIDKIAEMARRFGLGSRLDIELPNENPGLIPTKSWKREVFAAPWTAGEDFNAGIGQGYILVTPLQLAVMSARIANGGFAVRPYLVNPFDNDKKKTNYLEAPSHMGISANSISTIMEGMIAVTAQPSGTAYGARILDQALAMGGKTGTAQVRRLSKLEHHLEKSSKPEELPWKSRDHALFTGFAPVSSPRFSCSVVIEHGGWGASAAAPVARDVMTAVQKKYPV